MLECNSYVPLLTGDRPDRDRNQKLMRAWIAHASSTILIMLQLQLCLMQSIFSSMPRLSLSKVLEGLLSDFMVHLISNLHTLFSPP